MVDLVVAEVEGQQLVVSEEQFSNHHCAIGLNFVQIKVQSLQQSALLKCFSQVLSTLALDVVSLQVKTEQTWRLRDEVTESFCTNISDLVVTEVNIFNE